MGLLTGLPRNATARVPEGAVVLKFSKLGFERLVFGVPSFAFYIACLLARRLQQTTIQLHFYSHARELAGSLDFFDLPTIFQTIGLSQQNGLMEVRLVNAEVLGEFAFAMGKPIQARYRHLYGKEALLEFFQATPKATFSFASLSEPPTVEDPLDVRDVNEFLMEALHQRDELHALQETLDLDVQLGRLHGHFQWKGEQDFRDCALMIWEFLTDKRMSTRDLYQTLPYCQYTVTQVVVEMLRSGLIAPANVTHPNIR
jgi:CRP-like cAMP-binding protein